MNLPAPSLLIGHPKFPEWYPGQDVAFSSTMDWLASGKRFYCLSVPTGSGKSLLAILAAKMSGRRTIILTATKGLQDQIMGDFASIGAVNIKGQNNYRCTLDPSLRVDDGPCHDGIKCEYKANGCPYYERLAEAIASPIVVTNYAYYMAQIGHSSGLGHIDLLVMDEAHMAFSTLESYLQCFFGRDEIGPFGIEFPQTNEWMEWKLWASRSRHIVSAELDRTKAEASSLSSIGHPVPSALSRRNRTLKLLEHKMATIAGAIGKWIAQKSGSGWRLSPVWVSQYGPGIFQDTPKVLLMSAILSEKTVDAIGVPKSERDFLVMDSYFPIDSTPVVHVPTARINHRLDEYGAVIWATRIDQIIQRRTDRKGIVFTVSYKRRDDLMQRSRYNSIMMSHSREDVIRMVERFRESKAPSVFISPSVTSGWDFPEDDCRYIVIGKIPYPDTRDPVMKERTKDDKDWTSFMAMETLVNEAGRGTRSRLDKCEVLIVDDSWKWFYPSYKQFAPTWFQDRVVGSVASVPDPLI